MRVVTEWLEVTAKDENKMKKIKLRKKNYL